MGNPQSSNSNCRNYTSRHDHRLCLLYLGRLCQQSLVKGAARQTEIECWTSGHVKIHIIIAGNVRRESSKLYRTVFISNFQSFYLFILQWGRVADASGRYNMLKICPDTKKITGNLSGTSTYRTSYFVRRRKSFLRVPLHYFQLHYSFLLATKCFFIFS